MQKNKVGKVISSILVVGIITNYFLGGESINGEARGLYDGISGY